MQTNSEREQIQRLYIVPLTEAGYKDGQTVLKKTWSPKRGEHWERMKLFFNHPLFGLYPYLQDKIGARAPLMWQTMTIKKVSGENEIIL